MTRTDRIDVREIGSYGQMPMEEDCKAIGQGGLVYPIEPGRKLFFHTPAIRRSLTDSHEAEFRSVVSGESVSGTRGHPALSQEMVAHCSAISVLAVRSILSKMRVRNRRSLGSAHVGPCLARMPFLQCCPP